MTWMERFEDTIKTPAIATLGRFDCMQEPQRDKTHRLDANRAPACVKPAVGGGSIEQFAAAWNQL